MNSQWRRESNRVFGRFAGRPASGAPSLRVLSCVRVRPGNQRAAPLRKRLERLWTRESPVHTVESAPLGRNSKDTAWPKAACDVTRVDNGLLWPSITGGSGRTSRRCVA